MCQLMKPEAPRATLAAGGRPGFLAAHQHCVIGQRHAPCGYRGAANVLEQILVMANPHRLLPD